jgi:hypothetical protein
MGLLLRPDAYYAQTSDGAYVLTHDGESSFVGRSVHELIDRLAPFLDGRHSLDELTAGLSAERRTMVRDLVTTLLERSIVRYVEPDDAPGAAPPEHRHEIAFIGNVRDSPVAAFGEYRETVTMVIGAGRLCAAVADAAVRSGLRDVRVVATPDDPRAIGALLNGADLVLHADDRPMLERARILDRVCGAANVPLAQALVLGADAWITTATGASWTSGVRRLLAWRPETGEQDASTVPSDLAAKAVAIRFVHGVFRSITDAAEPVKHRITSVDVSVLTSRTHTFVPHPFENPSGGETDLVDRIAVLRGSARFDDERFSRQAFLCTGDRVGVFTPPTERDFGQIPLRVCAAEVSDPAGLLGAGPVPRVTGAALDFATARYRAALAAFATYASLMIDPRRVRLGSREDSAEPLLSGLRTGRLTGFVEAYGLADGAVHRLDVARVFPALRAPAVPYAPPPGVAAAYDWDEAVVAGLLDQCLRLTMDDAMTSPTPFARVDLAGAVLDERGDRYRALLAGLSEPVTVYDITGPLGVPTVVSYLGSVPVGCASSLSAAGGVTDVLEQLILHRQSRDYDQPDYAPPPVRDLPPRLRGDTTRALSDTGEHDGDTVAGALVRRGHRPVAIPLDHDPEVSAVMPYVVRVMIVDE